MTTANTQDTTAVGREPVANPLPGVFRRAGLAVVLTLWAGATVAGVAALWAYGARPGAVGQVPNNWPAGTRLTPGPHRYVLVMTLHPRCPCSRATLRELELVVAHGQGRLDPMVLFAGPGAEGSELWQAAAAIPDVRVVADPAGREAELFGVATSGQVALYDPAGRLRFRGGVTPARGHSGDNTGRDAVRAVLAAADGLAAASGPAAPSPAVLAPAADGRVTPIARTPVYGCPIRPPLPHGAP